jgi:hypothetical protein
MPDDDAHQPARDQTRLPRRRWARGADRPQYLHPGDNDRLVLMLVGLMSEVSALRDRLDTHEALAEVGAIATTTAVEAYELTPERQAMRVVNREAMLKRVLRAITEQREAAVEKRKHPVEVNQAGPDEAA